MTLQICPECQTEADERSLVCDCGHLFLDAMDVRGHHELRTIKWGKTKGRLKKITFIGAIALLGTASILYWMGWTGSAEKSFAEAPVNMEKAPAPVTQNLISPSGNPNPKTDTLYIVTVVSTGDTITVLGGNNDLHRVRIYGIVSPKLDENFGNEARVYLSRQILGKSISLVTKKSTDDGTLVAEVFLDGINIGVEQVRAGLAQLTLGQTSQPDALQSRPYLDAEFVAKSGRFGIWAGGINGFSTVAGGDMNGVPANPTPLYGSSRGSSKFRFTGINSPYDASNEPVELVRQELPASTKPIVPAEQDKAPANSAPKNDETAKSEIDVPAETEPSKPHAEVKRNTAARNYTRGSRGGCYYLSASGNRVYVDRNLCN